MTWTPIDIAVEVCLSRLPEDVVRHWTNAQREFLDGLQALVDRCFQAAGERVDEYARRAEERRAKREGHRSEGHRVTIEEEDDSQTA